VIAGTTLQIHPTLRCNLRCAHCYSDSGPWARSALASGRVVEAIAYAAELGYERLSVSGGEPLLYGGLREILLAARDYGMRTTVTTNGMLLDPRRLAVLQGAIDLVAVSVDGPAQLHDAIRMRAGAFARTELGLRALAEARIPFGIAHTLTAASAPHLAWLIDYARDLGATLVQIHPLQRTGRGVALSDQQLRHAETLQRVYVYAALRQIAGLLPVVHVDLIPSGVAALRLRTIAERLLEGERCPSLVETLVLDAEGRFCAYSANASAPFVLSASPGASLRETWVGAWCGRIGGEIARVADELAAFDEAMLVNWFDWIVDGARPIEETTVSRDEGADRWNGRDPQSVR
jgi:MoaA/NifB/PqqE/SkfB family radical SAM enzyme